jgi:putative ABC transport system ATP-binding protein
MPGEPLIRLEDIWKTYLMGGARVDALKKVTCEVKHGEYLAIVGPSGSGKSTLMNVIGCLDTPSEGRYYLSGELVSNLDDERLAEVRSRRIGFVFQTFNLLPRLSALDNVALPLAYANIARRDRRTLALEAVDLVQLNDRKDHRPSELSGGQRQRVAIARALVNKPSLILADEPTGNLDQKVGREIIALFENLNRDRGVTLILVTHDRELAVRAKRRLELLDGELVADVTS